MDEDIQNIPLKDKIDYLMAQQTRTKTKKFRVPRKGIPSKNKLKKGYISVMRIDDNGNVSFEKQQIEDSSYRLKTGEYHSLEAKDILSYKGKPFIIQPTRKLNPYNPLQGANETYGQKYVMARMLKDAIKIKKNMGNMIIWILIIGAIIFGVQYFMNK